MIAAIGTVVPTAPSIFESGLPIDEVFGLPLHPLVVHAAVVLIPLAALGLVLMAIGQKQSKRFGPLVVAVALAAAGSAFLAMASGRDLAERYGYGEQQHFDLGGWMPWVGLVLFANCLLLWLVDLRSPSRGLPGTVLSIAGFVVAAVATGLTIWTGHLGAELVWGRG